jgi:hypothetical protein
MTRNIWIECLISGDITNAGDVGRWPQSPANCCHPSGMQHPEPGGFTAISRWLSEATPPVGVRWLSIATPPDFAGAATTNRLQRHQRFFPVSTLPCRLGGDPIQSERPATPAGVGGCVVSVNTGDVGLRPQSPANGCHPSGM